MWMSVTERLTKVNKVMVRIVKVGKMVFNLG